MIVNFFIVILVTVVNVIFSWLPIVTTLPTINGFDLDSAFVTGFGEYLSFANAFWYVNDVFVGFLALLVYYGIKMVLKIILGHRAPGSHS